MFEGEQWDLNPQPLKSQFNTLPIKLYSPKFLAKNRNYTVLHLKGFEPLTSSLENFCSSN